MRKPKVVNSIEKLLLDSEKTIKIVELHSDIMLIKMMSLENRVSRLEQIVLGYENPSQKVSKNVKKEKHNAKSK